MKKIKEQFKPVLGYEGYYQVSNTGRVYSIKRKKFLTPSIDKYGYLYVNLSKQGQMKTIKVHRIVAETFLGRKLEQNEDIHHLMDKTDNTFEHMLILPHAEHLKLHKIGTHHSEQTKKKIGQKHKEWWQKKKKEDKKKCPYTNTGRWWGVSEVKKENI